MTAKHAPGPEYSKAAYRACLHGDADRRQQQSAAAQIVLLHGVKAELLEAAQAALLCIGELPPTQARVKTAQLLIAAINKAKDES